MGDGAERQHAVAVVVVVLVPHRPPVSRLTIGGAARAKRPRGRSGRRQRRTARGGRASRIARVASGRADSRRSTAPGSLSTMSPKTPPSPVGSGHVAAGVTQPAIAGDKSAAPNQARPRFGSRSTPRPLKKKNAPDHRRHQRAADRPKNCMARSEKTAPGKPIALGTGLSVAWLKLGSSTVQVPRLARPKATAANSAMPTARQNLALGETPAARDPIYRARTVQNACITRRSFLPARCRVQPGRFYVKTILRKVKVALTMGSKRQCDAGKCPTRARVMSTACVPFGSGNLKPGKTARGGTSQAM